MTKPSSLQSFMTVTALGLVLACPALFGETLRKTYQIKGFT
jgi:hypothetical protein